MHLKGLNPVAMLDENYGDLYGVIDHIAAEMDSDKYLFAAVVYGEVYLCTPSDPEESDAYWELIAEVGPGETGSWDSESDHVVNDLPDGYELVDLIGRSGRYLVYVNDE